MQVKPIILNSSPGDYEQRRARIFQLLAQCELDAMRESYQTYLNGWQADEGGEHPASFRAFVANYTMGNAWEETVIDALQKHIDKLAVSEQDYRVYHVFYSGGRHAIVANGTRGDDALYESIARHPAGYIAVTDYYSGGSFDEAHDNIPEGGMLWHVVPAEYQLAQTVSKQVEEETAVASKQPYSGAESLSERMLPSMEAFAREDRIFEELVPYACANFAEYLADAQRFDRKGEMPKRSDALEDLVTEGGVDYFKAAVIKRHGCGVEFEHHTDREPYGHGYSAWIKGEPSLHVGEYRCDTERGVVFA